MRQEPRANIYRDAWAGELRADRCGTEAGSPAGSIAAATTAG